MRRNLSRVFGAVVLAASVHGCFINAWLNPGTDGGVDGSMDVSPDGPASMSVTQSVDGDGGTLRVDGVTLSVPPGALVNAVSITVRRVGTTAPSGYDAFSPVYAFEPAGIQFAVPVTVTFTFTGDASRVQFLWTAAGSTTVFEALPSRTALGTITAQTQHFSMGFAGAPSIGMDAGADVALVDVITPVDVPPPVDGGADVVCSSGRVACGTACVDTQTDPANCGGCGVACGAGRTCTAGSCISPSALEVSVGDHNACAVMSDHSVRCWGAVSVPVSGTRDFCTVGTVSRDCYLHPSVAPSLSGIAHLSLNSSHSCAVTTSGQALCWGDNSEGELGDGTTTGGGPVSPALFSLSQIETAPNANAALSEFTCAVGTGGSAYCFGGNAYGQFGIGRYDRVPGPNPTMVMTSGVRQISAGRGFTCAVMTDATVRCWGRNSSHTLGYASTETCLGPECTTLPTAVPGLTNVAELDCGAYHTCARMNDGTVRCWGGNGDGELGDGSAVLYSVSPVTVSGLTGVTQITSGYEFSCALRSDGTVWCWGRNDYGQLGDGSTTSASTPRQVAGLTNVTQISAGGYTYSASANMCARRSDGSVWCWGTNAYGQLGNGTSDPYGMPMRPTAVVW